MIAEKYQTTFRKGFSFFLVALVFIAGFFLGAQINRVMASGSSQQSRDQLFAPFWEAWDVLHANYVEPLDDEALMEAALTGMLDSLDDQHTFYMNPETFAIVNTDLEGEFSGIGATVRQNQETGALIIVSTMPDSPAERADIRSGDAIVQVDGIDITDQNQTEIINQIRGPVGTEVNLGILRSGETELLNFTVVRARIQVDSVVFEELDGGYAYIDVQQFGSSTADDLRDVLQTYDVESRPGLILDFRGNPGGYLETAVDVASEFLAEGVILRERFRDSERTYDADGNATAPTVPMVVLVDEGSASASELVAGALQDQQRATVVGTVTFGKGSVQTWQELSNGGGVRVTIAKWYTPNDRSIHEIGLVPDVEVSLNEGSEEDTQLNTALDMLIEQVAITQP